MTGTPRCTRNAIVPASASPASIFTAWQPVSFITRTAEA